MDAEFNNILSDLCSDPKIAQIVATIINLEKEPGKKRVEIIKGIRAKISQYAANQL